MLRAGPSTTQIEPRIGWPNSHSDKFFPFKGSPVSAAASADRQEGMKLQRLKQLDRLVGVVSNY
jgi:hypothetical protein